MSLYLVFSQEFIISIILFLKYSNWLYSLKCSQSNIESSLSFTIKSLLLLSISLFCIWLRRGISFFSLKFVVGSTYIRLFFKFISSV